MRMPRRSDIRLAGILAAGILAADAARWLAVRLSWMWSVLVLAVFLALAVEPLVRPLSKVMPRGAAAAASLLAVTTATVAVAWEAVRRASSTVAKLLEAKDQVLAMVGSAFGADLRSSDLLGRLGSVDRLEVLAGASSAAATWMTAMALAVFISAEAQEVRRRWPPRAARVWDETSDQVGRFVAGYTVLALAAGAVTWLVAWAAGLPGPLGLGAWAALWSMVPMFGGFAAGALPVASAMLADLDAGRLRASLLVAAALVVFQAVDNYLLRPKVLGAATRLHPMVVLVALMVGGLTAGMVGLVMAVPAAAAAQVAYRAWRKEGGPA